MFPLLARGLARRSGAQLAAIVAACWVAMLVPTAIHYAGLPTGFTPLSDAPESLAEATLHALPPLRLPDFLAGMALARLLATQRRVPARTLAWTGVAAFTAVLLFLASPARLPERFVANGLLSPLFGAVLLGAASARPSTERLLQRLRLTTLGDASLSMFLLHMPIMLALAAAQRRWPLSQPMLAAAVLAFVPTMVVISVACEDRLVKPVAGVVRAMLRGTAGAARPWRSPGAIDAAAAGRGRETPPPGRTVSTRANAA
jgi:peptidoglycan/LPS O-acetylase OafA/YrhL